MLVASISLVHYNDESGVVITERFIGGYANLTWPVVAPRGRVRG